MSTSPESLIERAVKGERVTLFKTYGKERRVCVVEHAGGKLYIASPIYFAPLAARRQSAQRADVAALLTKLIALGYCEARTTDEATAVNPPNGFRERDDIRAALLAMTPEEQWSFSGSYSGHEFETQYRIHKDGFTRSSMTRLWDVASGPEAEDTLSLDAAIDAVARDLESLGEGSFSYIGLIKRS